MSKIDYAAVSSKLSELFYKQIELEKSLTRDADDRIDDMYGRASSTKASFAAEDWFAGERKPESWRSPAGPSRTTPRRRRRSTASFTRTWRSPQRTTPWGSLCMTKAMRMRGAL